MRAKIIFLIIWSLISCDLYSGTWYPYCYFPVPYVSSPFSNSFIDGYFINPNAGLYNYVSCGTPSSGCYGSSSITTNGGTTWTGMGGGCGLITGKGDVCLFFDQTVMTHYTTLRYSNDGGNSWVNFNLGVGDYGPASIINFNNFYAIKNTRSLYKYKDGVGNPNYAQFGIYRAYNLFFTDTSTGYVIADTGTTRSFILKTISGGINWTLVYEDTFFTTNLFFTSPTTGYSTALKGKITKTIDGGASWLNLNSGTLANLYSIFFLNDSIGYVAGDSGIIIKTSDSGQTWQRDSLNSVDRVSKIYFVNDTFGFALSNGFMYANHRHQPTGLIEQVENSFAFSVYPNPTSSSVTITVDEILLGLQLSVTDVTGRIITSLQLTNTNSQLSTKNWAKGVYFLQTIYNGQRLVKRLVNE